MSSSYLTLRNISQQISFKNWALSYCIYLQYRQPNSAISTLIKGLESSCKETKFCTKCCSIRGDILKMINYNHTLDRNA